MKEGQILADPPGSDVVQNSDSDQQIRHLMISSTVYNKHSVLTDAQPPVAVGKVFDGVSLIEPILRNVRVPGRPHPAKLVPKLIHLTLLLFTNITDSRARLFFPGIPVIGIN